MKMETYLYSGITDVDGATFCNNNTVLILYNQTQESYVVPDGVIRMMHDVFRGHKELKNITLPESLKRIGEDAFRGCENLTSIVLPAGMMLVEFGAFWDCKNLTSVIIPDDIEFIGEHVFSGCDALQSVVFKGKTYHTVMRESYRGYETRDLPQEFYKAVNKKPEEN